MINKKKQTIVGSLALTMVISSCVFAKPSNLNFNDPSQWAISAVCEIEKHLGKYYLESISYQSDIVRADFKNILYNSIKRYPPFVELKKDTPLPLTSMIIVTTDGSYNDSIIYNHNFKISTELMDSDKDLNENITREEIALIMSRVYKKVFDYYDVRISDVSKNIKDQDQIDTAVLDSVKFTISKSILTLIT